MFDLQPPQDDGLYITEDVGEWSREKHYYLQRYIHAFTNSMKNKGWHGLHYIDLFAGSGIERIKEAGELEWGSPLIAAQSPYPFSALHLCEKDHKKFTALKSRVGKYHPNVQLLEGDSNERVTEIIKEIPDRSLSLVFLDSYGLHTEYETVRKLSFLRSDLIIFFPDHLDAVRNWEAYYYKNKESTLDRYLGEGVDWRVLVDSPLDKYAENLRKLYELQLRKLGYQYFSPKRIYMTKGRPLYLLIFCSKNEIALKLWNNISLKDRDGQRNFNFPD